MDSVAGQNGFFLHCFALVDRLNSASHIPSCNVCLYVVVAVCTNGLGNRGYG
jgi:hypothetical protein